jgi:tetratricopeptide (TPR) repeat protein
VRIAIVLFVLALAGSAHAETAPEAEARESYARGKLAFAQARYAEALEHFERAYALSQAPALLFNMAQAERLSGPAHCARSLSLYRSYVAALPDADNRSEADERIDEMQACVERQTQAARSETPREQRKVAEPARTKPAPSQAASSTAPILLTGVGAALSVAGAVLYAGALHNYREAQAECPCYPGRYATWETATYVSYGLLAAGGLTVATGVSWWLSFDPASNATPRAGLIGVSSTF